jgi:hypothetical protein
MREAKAKGDIRIAVAEDVRNAEIVTHNASVILRCTRNEGLRIGRGRLTEPICHDQDE